MQQLSGLDAAFLYLETANVPMHIGSLAIYDPSTAPGGKVGFKDILRYFEQRLHKARAFRQRVVRVPLGADHPYWIEDPDFDLEFHLRHIALPKPGDWRQLCIQTARLHARPLDLQRPLWEAWVIEGLDNVAGVPAGSFALMTKFHHAAVDGVSAAKIAAAFHDLTPDAVAAGADTSWRPEHHPAGVTLLARALLSKVRAPLDLGALVVRNAPAVARLGAGLVSGQLKMNADVPRTRFNGAVSPHRVFDGRNFSLDEVRAIKNAVEGATINDVMVSVCGGALRAYLQSKKELPSRSLIAMAPVSARTQAKSGAAGNMVSTLRLPVRSDIADPLARLEAVREESINAKKVVGAMGATLAAEAAQFLPSMSSGILAQAYGRWGLSERLPLLFNTVITNVPGVQVPLYSMGSKMVANFGLGPVIHGLGLFQPVISYNGQISVSAISCREMMPDPGFYCDCLEESFSALRAVTIKSQRKRAKRKVRKKAKPRLAK